jgi:CspA family cold shock protein
MSARLNGVVKWFNASKGYGFISNNDGKDLFVHFSSIRAIGGYRLLEVGQEVEFTMREGKKGLQAQDVVISRDENFQWIKKAQHAILRYVARFRKNQKKVRILIKP